MTQAQFVESCVETVADSAKTVARRSRHRPAAKKLLRTLAGKKNVLVTTHLHPDPDALASAMAIATLLRARMKDAKVTVSVKGRLAGGINSKFAELSNMKLTSWHDDSLKNFDAIILLDTQPPFAFSPLPEDIEPIAVIDHHRPLKRKPTCPFCDVRTDVGATTSIAFSYLMELDVQISPGLAASMLYAIESDLAGAAGRPGELDNIALSNLTLLADTHVLYQMRYVPLPQSYFSSFAKGLNNANLFDHALVSHLDEIDSLEKPAIFADSMLRFDQADWVLVTAVSQNRFLVSVRTSDDKLPASDMIRRILRGFEGSGGGHMRKAGGFVPLETGSPTEIERLRSEIRKRFLRALRIKQTRGTKLVAE